MLKSDGSVLSSAHGLDDGCACWPWRNTYSAWRILPSCYISSLITPLPGKSLCSWQIWQSQSHCWLVAWLRHAWTAPELQEPWLGYLWAGHTPSLFWHWCLGRTTKPASSGWVHNIPHHHAISCNIHHVISYCLGSKYLHPMFFSQWCLAHAITFCIRN